MAKVIGLSLSFCVSQILRGERNLEDVVGIVAATKCVDDSDFTTVVASYVRNYSEWRKNPEQAEQIAWHLWNSGKVYQPRVYDLEHPGYRQGIEITAADQWWFPVAEFEAEVGFPSPFTE